MSQIVSMASSVSPTTGAVLEIAGDTGGAVSPDGAGTINIIGSSTIDTTGSPLVNSIDISISGGTNGQLLIASTSGSPVWSTLTDGTNIVITEGSGSITISSTCDVLAINNQTGTSYTTVLSDSGKYVTMNNSSNSTFTVPPNSSVAYAIGTVIYVQQLGAGIVTITQGAGVTFRSAGDAYKVALQNSIGVVIKIAIDTWAVGGDVSV